MNWIMDAKNHISTAKILHRNWNKARRDAFCAVNMCCSGEFICVTGASRVGKTKLSKELLKMIIGDQPLRDGHKIPIIQLTARNTSTNGKFSTKGFVKRALKTVNHPFYGNGMNEGLLTLQQYDRLARIPEDSFYDAFDDVISILGTKYLIIDEAHHVRYAGKYIETAAAIYDSWKCFADDHGLILIVVGAYPLLEILAKCNHMLGRKHFVHFPRYYPNEMDVQAFNQILDTYSKFIRLPGGVDSLIIWNELLFEGSVGCIGHLELWLRDALGNVMANDDKVLAEKHLLRTIKPKRELNSIRLEIKKGEEAILTGFEDELKQSNVAVEENNLSQKPKKRKGKPFQTNPRRYPIDGRVKLDD